MSDREARRRRAIELADAGMKIVDVQKATAPAKVEPEADAPTGRPGADVEPVERVVEGTARACPVCGQTFVVARVDARLCSARCRQRVSRAARRRQAEYERTCAECGASFVVMRADARFCSGGLSPVALQEDVTVARSGRLVAQTPEVRQERRNATL